MLLGDNEFVCAFYSGYQLHVILYREIRSSLVARCSKSMEEPWTMPEHNIARTNLAAIVLQNLKDHLVRALVAPQAKACTKVCL